VLSLVCGLDVPPVLLSTLADTAAAAIERELLHSTEPRERVLVDAYLPERARTSGVLALDGRTRVVSDSAASVLVESDLALLEELAATAVRADRLGAPDILLPGSGRTAHLREVLHGGAVAGVLVTLDQPDSEPVRPSGRPPGRRRRPRGLPGLVGDSPAWQALLRRVEEIPTGAVVALTGEWGAGRSAIALALGARRGRPTIEFHAIRLAADPAASWLPDLAGALERGSTVVLRDADTMPARSAAALRALLGRRPGGWVLLTGETATGGIPWHQSLVPDGGCEEVEVPPLRDRAADLGDLVDALSAPHLPEGVHLRLALDATAALRRWSWPGNVAELRALVVRLCAVVGAERPVTSADLPGEMRQGHRTFTGLEQAERAAIRTALRTYAGNRSRAAASLGIGRTTLYRKLRHYGLQEG
jgi:transcriptional regulator of acetoin/glycerol metabolism